MKTKSDLEKNKIRDFYKVLFTSLLSFWLLSVAVAFKADSCFSFVFCFKCYNHKQQIYIYLSSKIKSNFSMLNSKFPRMVTRGLRGNGLESKQTTFEKMLVNRPFKCTLSSC